MYCDTNSRVISIFMIHFLGGLIILLISYLSDRFGRKIFFIIIVLAGILGSILLLIPSGLIVSALGVAFGNFLVDFMLILGFTYYAEMSTKDSRNVANVVMFLSIAFGSFVCLIIATFTSGFTFVDVVVLVLLFPLLVLSLALRESLYYLYNNKEKKEFFRTLKLIAEINDINLRTVISDLNPQMAESTAFKQSFQVKNKFNSNPGYSYSYRDFSADFNEFSMRGTEYYKDNPFNSYSKERVGTPDRSSDLNFQSREIQRKRNNMFNYSMDRHLKNSNKMIDNPIGTFPRHANLQSSARTSRSSTRTPKCSRLFRTPLLWRIFRVFVVRKVFATRFTLTPN